MSKSSVRVISSAHLPHARLVLQTELMWLISHNKCSNIVQNVKAQSEMPKCKGNSLCVAAVEGKETVAKLVSGGVTLYILIIFQGLLQG